VIYHKPVLLKEVIGYLKPKENKEYIDVTAGGGGHTLELLKKKARVLAIDRDPEAIEYIKKNQYKFLSSGNLVLVKQNFANLAEIAKNWNFKKNNGILFDLGVSSWQLENETRGFSFDKSGPLDMRMDPELGICAKDIINNFNERRLYEVFKTYGQEKFSRTIARAICRARQVKTIETTAELSLIVKEVYQKRNIRSKLHPATKTFLALRIVVNSELLNLEKCLPQTVDLLKKGGRLVIVSFQSLEDVIVKRFFKQEKKMKVLTKKPIVPDILEILKNPRARSAKLRVAERI